jgi:hypothetical protein
LTGCGSFRWGAAGFSQFKAREIEQSRAYCDLIESQYASRTKPQLEVQMDQVHLVWLGLVALFIVIAVVLAALKSLPVRPRR